MKNKKSGFNKKKLKYGGYATLMACVFIAIVVVVNLVVGELNLKVDLTTEKLFSLSEETNEVMKGINAPIKIYALVESGKENPIYKEAVETYEKKSNYIVVEEIDPVLNPGFIENFKKNPEEVIAVNSFIVQNEGNQRFRVVTEEELTYYNQYSKKTNLRVEQAITSALDYVTKERLPQVYVLTGHNEEAVSPIVLEDYKNQNYDVKDINLLTEELEVAEENVLLINAPKNDLAKEEADKIKEYLSAGGRAMIYAGFNSGSLKEFSGLLSRYGLEVEQGFLIEQDQSKVIGNNAINIIPDLAQHAITKLLVEGSIYPVLPRVSPLLLTDQKKSQTEVTPLLVTGNQAFLRTNIANVSPSKSADEKAGVYNMAVAVEETNYDTMNNNNLTTKLVVVGTPYIMEQSALMAPGNRYFLINSMNWLSDQKDVVSIVSKEMSGDMVQVDGGKALIYSGLFLVILPLLVIGYGIFVWLRRRHL